MKKFLLAFSLLIALSGEADAQRALTPSMRVVDSIRSTPNSNALPTEKAVKNYAESTFLSGDTVAGAGTVQGDATALASGRVVVHNISSGATSSGARLPTPVANDIHVVVNTGSNFIILYPATSGQIENSGTNAGLGLAAGQRLILTAVTTILWEVNRGAVFSATNPPALGTASPGTAVTVARSDHVHPNTFINNSITSTTVALTASQCGSTVVNDSADVLTLPEASTVIGCRFTFMTNNASNFDVNPADASDTIPGLTNAAGDAIRNATVNNFICLQAVDSTNWNQCGILGTWSDVN